jgi:hypothetical protein
MPAVALTGRVYGSERQARGGDCLVEGAHVDTCWAECKRNRRRIPACETVTRYAQPVLPPVLRQRALPPRSLGGAVRVAH